jgi:hypothetical protein
VSEAAEVLEISEAAVRKRMHRGTLEREHRPDGRVYVYVDAGKLPNRESREAAGTESSDGGHKNEQRSWWDYIAAASGLAVVFGGLTYALGFFVLLSPIALTLTHDFGTAWHATFLVPRGMVAGLGIRQLVAFPLLVGAVIFGLSFAAYVVQSAAESKRWMRHAAESLEIWVPWALIILYASWRIDTGPTPLSQAPFFLIIVLVLELFMVPYMLVGGLAELAERKYAAGVRMGGWVVFALVIAYVVWRDMVSDIESLQKPSIAIGALISAAIVIGAATLVAWGGHLGKAFLEEPSESEDDTAWTMLWSFIAVSAAAFVAAFMLTIPSNPPLPMVEIDVKDKDKASVGRLLAHTDGFWYVFEIHNGQSEDRLTAIPDDNVKKASVAKVRE